MLMANLSKAYNLSQALVKDFGLSATIKRYTATVDDFGEMSDSTLSTIYNSVPVVIKKKRLPPPDLSQNKLEYKTYYDAVFNLETSTGTSISLQEKDIVEIDGNTYILLNFIKEPLGIRALLAVVQ